MTNLEKWRFYLKDIISPDSYIDMSFYYIISAALQRRVWVGPPESALFPNMYIILVGEPGTGKGLVIKPTTDILRYHKVNPKAQKVLEKVKTEGEDSIDSDLLAEAIKQMAAASGVKLKPQQFLKEKLVIPLGPDSVTYESLVLCHKEARSFLRTPHSVRHIAPNCRYMHNSMSLVLEEVSTMFRKKAEDVIKYLLKAYDCNDFEYLTVGRGMDSVHNPCLGLLGGTTPNFVVDSFSDKLFSEGFASRTIFVFDPKPRFHRFGMAERSEEQHKAFQDVIEHVKILTGLFGQVTYTPEAYAYFKNYFENVLPHNRVNDSEKLNGYYARKNITGQKMAIAVHFSDNVKDFVLTLKECKEALRILEELENKMHLAFQSGYDEFSKRCSSIKKYLEISSQLNNGKTEAKTLRELWQQFPMKELELIDCLEYLCGTHQVEIVNDTPTKEVSYKIKK